MKKLSIAAVFLALVSASLTFGQHRKPDEQPQRPPAEQAKPRDADGKAKPREAQPPERRPAPRQGERVVVPYPVWPWAYPPVGYPPYGFRVYTDWESSHVRLEVSPDDARVFVDRYYAGVVDDFDGIFQRLTLHAGPHLIEIRKDGYRSLAVELNLYPGQTVTYRRTMEPSTGGDAPATVVALPPAFDEGAALPPVDAPPGDVKIDVTPDDAAIYADGFYVGIVDDFNGGQHLQLTVGRHHLAFVKEGYETLDVDLSIDTPRTITYRATMKKS